MKYFMLHIFLHDDECAVDLSKFTGAQIRFTFHNYGGDIDWGTVFKYIRFFEPEHVIISPRAQVADGMTDAQEVSCG